MRKSLLFAVALVPLASCDVASLDSCPMKFEDVVGGASLAPGQVVALEVQGCETCGHSDLDFAWDYDGAEPSGDIVVSFCGGCGTTGACASGEIPATVAASQRAFAFTDQGIKNLCGEEAKIYWKGWIRNNTDANVLRPTLSVHCPQGDDLLGDP
jgi:hypothetical protein